MTTSAPSPTDSTPFPEPEGKGPANAGSILLFWMLATVLIQAALWISGARSTEVIEAVDTGAARTETTRMGEVEDEVIRKAIVLQQNTLPFWTTISAIGDFGGEPAGMALRTLMVASIFAGLAMLRGRSVEYGAGLSACAMAQGFWVLGLAVRLALTIVLKRSEIETSAVLLIPPGPHTAIEWAAARQLDLFALLGWLTMARSGWRLRQVGPIAALLICGSFFAVEALGRMGFALMVGAGMRLTLMPEV